MAFAPTDPVDPEDGTSGDSSKGLVADFSRLPTSTGNVINKSQLPAAPATPPRESSGEESFRSLAPVYRSRTVLFDDTVEIWEIPHIHDMTPCEVNCTWNSTRDYMEMQTEIFLTEALLESDKHPDKFDDRMVCSRGVSSFENMEKRMEANSFVRAMVLSQYAYWMQESANDVDRRIAEVYAALSEPAARKALDIAARDQDDAATYLAMDLCKTGTQVDEGATGG